MHINGMHIERFGILEKQNVPSLSQSLSIFYGLNEAGKSTCLRFFKSMLFGYKRGRQNLDTMLDKKNATAGGSLFLNTSAYGDIVLTRRPDSTPKELLRKSSGAALPENSLNVLLQGLTQEVFDNVFAFDLKTLMDIGNLKEGDVRHALFAARFGMGSKSPSLVIKELDNKLKNLFSRINRSTSNAAINTTLQQLQTVQKDILAHGLDMDIYAQLEHNLVELQIKLQNTEKSKKILAEQRKIIQHALANHENWESLQSITAILGHHSKEELDNYQLSQGSQERLNSVLEQKKHILLALNRQHALLKQLEEEKNVNIQQGILIHKNQLYKLLEDKSLVAQNFQSIADLHVKVSALENRQKQQLAKLGATWTLNKIQNTPLTIIAKEDIQSHDRALKNAAAAFTQAKNERLTLEDEINLFVIENLQQALPANPACIVEEGLLEQLGSSLTIAKQTMAELPQAIDKKEKAASEYTKAAQNICATWQTSNLEALNLTADLREHLIVLAKNIEQAEHEYRQDALSVASLKAEIELKNAELQKIENTLQQLESKSSECMVELETFVKQIELAIHDSHKAVERVSQLEASKAQAKSTSLSAILWVFALLFFIGASAIFFSRELRPEIFFYTSIGLTIFAFLGFVSALVVKSNNPLKQMLAVALQDKEMASNNLLHLQENILLHTIPLQDLAEPLTAQNLIQIKNYLEREQDAYNKAKVLTQQMEDGKNVLSNAIYKLENMEKHCTTNYNKWRAELDKWQHLLKMAGLPEHTEYSNLQNTLSCINLAKVKGHLAEENLLAYNKMLEQVAKPLDLAASSPFFTESLKHLKDVLLPIIQEDISIQRTGSSTQLVHSLLLENEFLHCTELLDKLSLECEKAKQEAIKKNIYEQALQRRKEHEERLKFLQNKLLQKSNKEKDTQNILEQYRKNWEAWLLQHGLDQSLSTETAFEAIKIIEDILESIITIKELEEQKQYCQEQIQNFLKHVAALQATVGQTGIYAHSKEGFDKAVLFLENLKQEIEKLTVQVGHQEQIGRQIKETLQQISSEEAMLSIKNAEEQNIFAAAKATSTEDFYKKFELWQWRQKEIQLERLLQKNTSEANIALEDLKELLTSKGKEELQLEGEDLAQAIKEKESELAAITEQKGAVGEKQQTLIQGRTSIALLQKEASLKENLRNLVYEWQTIAMAKHLFMQSKEVFEKESQQGVIGLAGEIFRNITDGEYTGIFLDMDNEDISALHKNGTKKDPEKALSQGTREQLYLALRLAYIGEHAQKAEAVPVIMDDILVNFDQKRFLRTAEVIADFAQHNQILFFTCHEKTAEALFECSQRKPCPAKLLHIQQGQISCSK